MVSAASNDLVGRSGAYAGYSLVLIGLSLTAITMGVALLRAPLLVTAALLSVLPAMLLVRRPALLALGYLALLPLLQSFGILVPVVEHGGVVSLNLMGVFNLVLLGCGAIALYLHRASVPWRALWPVMAFVLYLMATMMLSPERSVSARNWVAYGVSGMLAFLVSADRAPATLFRRAATALVFGATITAVMGIWQLGSWDLRYEFNGMPRITGAQGQPNAYAMVLIIAILATVMSIAHVPRSVWIPVLRFAVAVLALLLVFTFSRTGWITIAVCLGVAFLLIRNRLVGWGLVFLGLLAPLSLEVIPLFVSRFEPDEAVYLRFELISWGLEQFRGAPLFGHGVGTFALHSVQGFGAVTERYGVQMSLTPHNDSVRFLVEAGLVGLVLYAFLMVHTARLGLRLARSEEPVHRGLGVFLTSAVAGTVVFGIGGQGFAYSSPYLMPAMGLAAALAATSGETARLPDRVRSSQQDETPDLLT